MLTSDPGPTLTDLHEGRVDMVDLHKARCLVHWELAVLRHTLHCRQRLVVAHSNTGVEVDALSARHGHFADDVLGGWNLQCKSHDSHMTMINVGV